jgi:hypothetical protein
MHARDSPVRHLQATRARLPLAMLQAFGATVRFTVSVLPTELCLGEALLERAIIRKMAQNRLLPKIANATSSDLAHSEVVLRRVRNRRNFQSSRANV